MSVLNVADPPILQEEELNLFSQSALKFFRERAPEERQQRWRDDGMVDRAFWAERARRAFWVFRSQPSTGARVATSAMTSCCFEPKCKRGSMASTLRYTTASWCPMSSPTGPSPRRRGGCRVSAAAR